MTYNHYDLYFIMKLPFISGKILIEYIKRVSQSENAAAGRRLHLARPQIILTNYFEVIRLSISYFGMIHVSLHQNFVNNCWKYFIYFVYSFGLPFFRLHVVSSSFEYVHENYYGTVIIQFYVNIILCDNTNYI